MKKILYIDMDDTLCHFKGEFWIKLKENPTIKFPQSQYGFFTNLKPIDPNMKLILDVLANHYDVWIATRPSYLNPLCYTEKRVWVENHLGIEWCKKLILTPDKSLLKGDYLIDDILWENFEGEQLQFGTEKFPSLTYCLKYLTEKDNRDI